METHGIEENLFKGRACSLVCKKGSVEEVRKEMAAVCVTFLINAVYLAQKTPSLLLTDGTWNGWCIIGVCTYSLSARTWSGLPSVHV